MRVYDCVGVNQASGSAPRCFFCILYAVFQVRLDIKVDSFVTVVMTSYSESLCGSRIP